MLERSKGYEITDFNAESFWNKELADVRRLCMELVTARGKVNRFC